jgi:hypothetical protein
MFFSEKGKRSPHDALHSTENASLWVKLRSFTVDDTTRRLVREATDSSGSTVGVEKFENLDHIRENIANGNQFRQWAYTRGRRRR